MEHKKTNLLKDNQGVALVMVMFLLFVMTFLGGAMYAYTMQSLKVLEYGTQGQKAEYIARSGVEASVFMYQDAMLQDKGSTTDLHKFLEDTEVHTGDAEDKKEERNITTNWVLLEKDGKTFADGGEDDAGPTPPSGKALTDYTGYFRVTISNGTKTIAMPKPDGTTEEMNQPIKNFVSEGYCGSRKSVKKAYIIPLVDITSKGWLDEKGQVAIDALSIDADGTIHDKKDSTSMILHTKINIDTGLIDKMIEDAKAFINKINQEISAKYPPIAGLVPELPKSRLFNLPAFVACTSGNMVLNSPINADTKKPYPISFREEAADHVDGFLSFGNIFVNTSIDTEPVETHFNTLMLRGNKIVINGDIDLYAYDPQTNDVTGFTTWVSGLGAKIARNYRFSTVVLGLPSSVTSTVTDPMPKAAGGLGQCGQVYFGGDVYVNIITRGGQTRKYKAFRAGETYYFDGNFSMGKNEKNEPMPYGIDLLKFFLDTEISKNHRSSQVIQQFRRTRNFYYNNAQTEYKSEDDNSRVGPPDMRKIDYEKKNTYDKITDTILPSAGDGSYIIWE